MHQDNKVTYELDEDNYLNMDTEKMLKLAYSGFFNLYINNTNNESKLFERENTPIIDFFQKMNSFLKSNKEKNFLIESFNNYEEKRKMRNIRKSINPLKDKVNMEIDESIDNDDEIKKLQQKKLKKYYSHEILSHYAEKMLRIDMSESHRNAIKLIRKDNINPLCSNQYDDGNYSLFFLKNETLWEWREYSGEIIRIGKNIKSEFVKEIIYDYIKNKNIESEVFYEDDITCFSEITDKSQEEMGASCENFFCNLLITIIFITNFFINFQGQESYNIRESMYPLVSNYTFKDLNTVYQSTRNLSEIGDKFINYWIRDFYYGSEKNDTRRRLKITNITDDEKDNLYNLDEEFPTFNYTNIQQTFYINDVNVLSGIIIKFNDIKTISKKTITGNIYEDIPFSTLDFDSINPEKVSENIFNDNYENKIDINYNPDADEIYIKPFYNDIRDVKEIENTLIKRFAKKINIFDTTFLFYNDELKLLYSFTIDIRLDSFGELMIKNFFYAMHPFINPETFVLSSIFSLFVILALIYLGLRPLRNFINSLLDSINSKSNQIKIGVLIEIIISLIIILSQVYFFLAFYLPKEKFSLKTRNKEDMVFWVQELELVSIYETVIGICIFFIIIRLLNILVDAIPSFGMVFQTLNVAKYEIFTFFLVLCLILVGIGCLAYSSFGYYSEDYKGVIWSFFHVYLMFIGIINFNKIMADRQTGDNSDFIFIIVVMLFFNLILINLFFSIILNNYKIVKEKYEVMNKVYSIMLQSKLKDFSSKIIDLLLLRHPQLIEWEMNKKKEQNSKLHLPNNGENENSKNTVYKASKPHRLTLY